MDAVRPQGRWWGSPQHSGGTLQRSGNTLLSAAPQQRAAPASAEHPRRGHSARRAGPATLQCLAGSQVAHLVEELHLHGRSGRDRGHEGQGGEETHGHLRAQISGAGWASASVQASGTGWQQARCSVLASRRRARASQRGGGSRRARHLALCWRALHFPPSCSAGSTRSGRASRAGEARGARGDTAWVGGSLRLCEARTWISQVTQRAAMPDKFVMYCVPDTWISCFSPGQRASTTLLDQAARFFNTLPKAKEKILKKNQEQFFTRGGDGSDVRRFHSFPSNVAGLKVRKHS